MRGSFKEGEVRFAVELRVMHVFLQVKIRRTLRVDAICRLPVGETASSVFPPPFRPGNNPAGHSARAASRSRSAPAPTSERLGKFRHGAEMRPAVRWAQWRSLPVGAEERQAEGGD